MSSRKGDIAPEVDSSDTQSQISTEKPGLHAKTPRALLDDAEVVTAQGNIITKDGAVISTEDGHQIRQKNVFQDPEIAAYYVGVYEKAKYESRHVFDPNATWTEEEEKRIIRKLDWRGM
jgi:hypothetical protein